MEKFVIIFIIILFNNQNVFCQETIKDISNYKVIYNLEYQKDSTDISTKQNEKMILLIGDKYSLFESLNKRYNDSIKSAIIKENLDISIAISKGLSQSKKSRFKFRILKNSKETLVYDSYFSDKFIYKDEEKLSWKIKKTFDTISGYNCTLATTSFAGRSYRAWFTKEIPISDGPYKFKGLPGLIVKIEDNKRHYIFKLVSFLKAKEKFEFDKKAGIEVSKKEFYNSYNSFKKNFISQLNQRGMDVISTDSRNLKKRVQKSRNNEIEIKY